VPDEEVDEEVEAGGTVETTGGDDPSDPVGTSVTSPNGGNVTILETSIGTTPPSGLSFDFTPELQQVDITAPAADALNPLVLTFDLLTTEPVTIVKTVLEPPSTTTAGACNDLTPGGPASPDPCVQSNTESGGTTHIVVRTSSASAWNFGKTTGANCKCVVKNIFPGGTVANLKFGNKPTQIAILGAEFGAVDNQGSNSCPDENPGTLFATADVHFNVMDEGGNPILDVDKTVTCINGVDNPKKFVLEFDASSCGALGNEVGVFDITTTVTGDAGTNQRIQRIRCKN
jgi:hypothetical protein